MKRVQIAFVALVIFNLSWRYLTVLIWLAFKVCLKLTLGPRGKERFTNGETIGIGSWRLSGIGGSRIISSLVHFPLLIKCCRSLTFSLFKVLVCAHWGFRLFHSLNLLATILYRYHFSSNYILRIKRISIDGLVVWWNHGMVQPFSHSVMDGMLEPFWIEMD